MSRLRALHSVRARTTLAATVAVAGALLLGSVVLVRTLDHSLVTAADQQSRARLTELLADARAGTLPRVVVGISDDSLAQVVAADGTVRASSANIVGTPAVRAPDQVTDVPTVRTMRDLPDDQETEDYRIWSARTRTPDGEVVAFVGPSLESAQEATRRLTQSLDIGLPLLLALLALAIWVTVGRALRPVEGVRREVAALSAGSLGRRVPVPHTHDEVARLATTMNALLERLETADRRQREFVGNASHDLQSPLTVLRTELEIALARADPEEWRHTGARLLAETDRMEALVGDLLFLAQAEDGRPPVHVPLDLDDLLAEEVARLPRTDGVTIDLEVTGVPVRGSRQQLARMVRNLLVNATGYAEARIAVHLAEEDDTAVLTVEDDGPGVPPEHREDVFGRFFTLDGARTLRAGTGLGLAIARSVAESHGGTLTLEGRSRFVVRLPGLAARSPAGSGSRSPA